VYRSVNAQYQVIAKNTAAIEAFVCVNDGQTKVKNALVEMARRVSIAVGNYLFHRANLREDDVPQKINAFLFNERVPIYIYNKLSAGTIAATSFGFDVRHLLFPRDPSKGFYLTFTEARDTDFTNNLMGLISGSLLTIQMARNDALIRLMTNLTETADLDSREEHSLGLKMANTPFYILPFEGGVEAADTLSFLAKNGVRGINWVSGTVLTPPDLLKFYGTISKRLYYGLLIRPALKAPLFEQMFGGFVYDRANDQQDIYAQLKTWSLRPGTVISWFTMFGSALQMIGSRELIKKVFVDVTMVGIEHAITHAFLAMFTATNQLELHDGTTTVGALVFTEIKNIAVTFRERAIDPDVIIGGRISLGKTRKANTRTQQAGVQERSMMTARSQSAIKILENRGYRALAARMRTWFRLFIDETIQEAVASVFLARLDAFLEIPLDVTKEEKGAFMEPDDPEDYPEDEIDETNIPADAPVNPDEA